MRPVRAFLFCVICTASLQFSGPAGSQQAEDPQTFLLIQAGWSSLGAQRYDAALSNFDRVLTVDPSSLSAKTGRARALAGLGQIDEALAITAQLRSIDPKFQLEDAAILLIDKQPQKALAQIDAAAAAFRKTVNAETNRREHNNFFRRAFFLRGDALYLLGGYERAGSDFKRAKDFGGGAAADRGIGDAYFALRNYSEAEKSYTTALQSRRYDGGAYRRRGRVRYLQGKIEPALTDFKEARVYLDDSVGLLSEYSEALIVAGNHADAVTMLTRLLKASEGNAEYQRKVRYHLAAALITANRPVEAEGQLAALESWRDMDVPRQFQRGRARYMQRDFVGAIRHFDAALSARKGDPQILYNRGISWLRLGEVEAALNDLSEAAVRAPGDPDIRDAIGRIRLSRGENDEALAFYNAAVKAQPNDHIPLIQRANARLATGNAELALNDANRALRMRPDNLEATEIAARALLVQGRTSESLELSKKLSATNSKKKEGFLLQAQAQIRNGNPDQAISLIDQANNFNADPTKMTILKGDAYASAEDFESAFQFYDEAARMSGNDPFILVKRGDVQTELGRHEGAANDYTLALERYRLSPSLIQKRGNSLYRLGLCAQAMADFDRVLAISPNDNAAMRARGNCRVKSGKLISGFSDIFRSLI